MRAWWKRNYERFISLKGDPKRIALGFAVGVMVGFFPILGVHTFIVMALAASLRIHFSAAFVGSWIAGNPFTFPALIAGEYYIGKHLFGGLALPAPHEGWTLTSAVSVGWDIAAIMIAGGILLAAPFAAASYPVVRFLVERNQRRRKFAA